MAEKVKFQPQKFDINSINGGNRYGLEGIQPEAVNAPIEAAAYAQALATNQPNIENAGLVGTPSVSIEEVDGLPRFKFANLKGADGAISVQYITDIDKILDDPYTLPTGTFDPVFPYIYLAYTTSSKTSYALYQYDPTEKTLTFLDNIRENVLYYVANGEKKGIYYALRSPFNLLRPLTITKGEFESLKESITATKNELKKNIDDKNFVGYSMESEKTYDCVKGGALDRRLKKIEQALKNNL